jgi:tetratricopeptide (TPR) repeat protein
MWVFWVHASNATRFEQAYREIAAQVELPGRDDPKMDILRLVHNWLCDERNGRWLMIVDNADDDLVFASTSGGDTLGDAAQADAPVQEAAAPLASFLPQAVNGSMLVTSRDLVAAMNLVGTRQNVIELKPMSEQDALKLLRLKVQLDESSEVDARALVRTLEGIPLAVTQAAAYIAVNEPRITCSTYLELFRESEENQAHLLNKETWGIRQGASVSSAVITAWQMSFERIRKTKPEAADLLSLMSMFDRHGIPEQVLYEGRTKLQFEDAVAPLTSFSLVQIQAVKLSDKQLGWRMFEMYSLVQLATREWVKLHSQLSLWQRAALRIMATAFPSGQHETWAACQTLLPHSTKVLGYSMQGDDEARLDQATIATNTARYLIHIGDYAKAERIGRSAAAVREDVFGREHPDTLTSVSQLGTALLRQGKYEEAEAMHRRALEGYEKALGREHPDTLTSVSNLGSVLERQGRYEEAEAMHRRALDGEEKALGREHPDTLTSVSQLATVLSRQGRYEEAEAMHRRALEGYEKALGREHPDTLTSVSNLGSVLERQGRYEEAEAMHRRALEGREKALGLEHPNTLTSVNDLGSVLVSQGKHEEAEGLVKEYCAAKPVFACQASVGSTTYVGQGSVGISQDETLIGQEETTISKKQIVDIPDDSSIASHTTTGREKLGKGYIARFLASDPEMSVLWSNILDRVDREQFLDIGRQMLKSFHLGLLEYAKTELEKRGTHLLKSRSGRRRICEDIADVIKFENAQNEEEKRRATEQLRLTEERLEMFTKDFSDTYPHQTLENEGELQTNSNDVIELDKQDTEIGQQQNGSLESEFESEDDDLPNLTRMKEFFRESEAFQVLLNDLRTQLLPHSIRDILLAAPHGSLSLSNQHNSSLSNRMKAFVEDFTMLRWNWWPLEPRMRDLNLNETRLLWKCVSGHPEMMLELTLYSLVARGSGRRSPGTTQT